MAKYHVTVMNENGKIVKQKVTSSIKDARAFGVRNLKTQSGTVYIKEGEIYSVKNSFMDAPGGRIERMDNTYYFIQDGVCWTVYKDGSLGRKEIL